MTDLPHMLMAGQLPREDSMVAFVLLLPALLFGVLLAMELVEARLNATRRMVRVEDRLDPTRSPFVDEATRR